MTRWLVILASVTAGCRIQDVDLTGKDCPCPGGWHCDLTTSTCARGAGSDAAGDSPADVGGNPITYRDAVVADAPIAYWRLDDTGGTAHDTMGRFDGVYSGTCSPGAPGALAGDTDSAVRFDGTSCEITLSDQLAFIGTAPYSVEAWIETPATIAGFRVVFSEETRMTGPVDGYAIVDSNTGAYFERAVAKSAPTTSHLVLATGRYVHLVGVYDGSAFVLYVDAVPGAAVTDSRAMPMFSAAALIGADSSGDWFLGSIDEVAVYDHALAANRIALHHQLGVSGS